MPRIVVVSRPNTREATPSSDGERLMGLHKRANSKNWFYSFQIKGKRFLGSTGTPNKTVAAQVERDARAKAHARVFLGQADEIRLMDAIHRYIESRKDKPYWPAMDSIARKINGHKVIPRGGGVRSCHSLSADMMLHELTTRDVERLVQHRKAEGNAPQTIKHEIGLIRAAMNEAARLGYRINREVIFPVIRTQSRLRYLDQAEEDALLRALHPDTLLTELISEKLHTPDMVRMVQDNYDLAVFLLDTGCRYSEAANIPWSSIDIENQTINLFRSKVQNESILHMTQRLYEVMYRRAKVRSASERHVFKNKQGESRGYSTNAFKKAFIRAGLNTPTTVKERGGKVTLHTLRHTFASKLVRAGISLYEVSVLLGHSDPKMTQRYAHLAPNETSRKAVQVIDRMLSPNAPSLTTNLSANHPSLRDGMISVDRTQQRCV